MLPKEPLTIDVVDNIKDSAENLFACMLLHALEDEFHIYHEPNNLTSPQSMRNTLPDFYLDPQPRVIHQAKQVYVEVCKSTFFGKHKHEQKQIAYDWLIKHPEAAYLQLCQPILDVPNFALSLIDQLAYGRLSSQQAQAKVTQFLHNPRKSLRAQKLHFIY